MRSQRWIRFGRHSKIKSFDDAALIYAPQKPLPTRPSGNLYGTIFPLPPVGNGLWPVVALTEGTQFVTVNQSFTNLWPS
jgi:hypothetical protein